MRKTKKKPNQNERPARGKKCVHKAYLMQAISQRNSTGEGNIAIPNDNNVVSAKEWVDENKL